MAFWLKIAVFESGPLQQDIEFTIPLSRLKKLFNCRMYAILSTLDPILVPRLMERGANVMLRCNAEVECNEDGTFVREDGADETNGFIASLLTGSNGDAAAASANANLQRTREGSTEFQMIKCMCVELLEAF